VIYLYDYLFLQHIELENMSKQIAILKKSPLVMRRINPNHISFYDIFMKINTMHRKLSSIYSTLVNLIIFNTCKKDMIQTVIVLKK
jgi:hypothetical protein